MHICAGLCVQGDSNSTKHWKKRYYMYLCNQLILYKQLRHCVSHFGIYVFCLFPVVIKLFCAFGWNSDFLIGSSERSYRISVDTEIVEWSAGSEEGPQIVYLGMVSG